jgi:hypothetical protein
MFDNKALAHIQPNINCIMTAIVNAIIIFIPFINKNVFHDSANNGKPA